MMTEREPSAVAISTECTLRPAPAIPNRPYVKPAAGPAIDLYLDANEGPAMPEEACAQLAKFASRARGYPDAAQFERTIADEFGVAPEQVIGTGGADDALDRVAAIALSGTNGQSILSTTPTFEMIARYAVLRGGRCQTVPWISGLLPVQAIADRINSDETIRAVFLVLPNNPTGATASQEEVAEVAKVCQRAGKALCIDQAYGEFSEVDLTTPFLRSEAVVITRTMSKAWGLAGLRLGFAIGDARIIAWMRAAGQPYPSSGPGLAFGAWWRKAGQRSMASFVERVRIERRALGTLLAQLGGQVVESHANFVFVRFDPAMAKNIRDGLACRGIAIRAYPADGPLAAALRITLPGNDASFLRLVNALTEVTKPDMTDTIKELQ
jgi:histidinol-phosphate aminotransferase